MVWRIFSSPGLVPAAALLEGEDAGQVGRGLALPVAVVSVGG